MLGLTPCMSPKTIESVRAPRDLLATQAGKVSREAGGGVGFSLDGTSVDRHWVCATSRPRMRPQAAAIPDRTPMRGAVNHAQQRVLTREL